MSRDHSVVSAGMKSKGETPELLGNGLKVYAWLLPTAVVHPECPLESVIFSGNGHCYWLGSEKAEWLEAQKHCKEYGNGNLAFVSSPDIQSFLVSRVTR